MSCVGVRSRRLACALALAALVPTGAPDAAAGARRAIHITVAASGDLLIHRPIWERARTAGGGYRFEPMLRYVKPYIAGADLALCHLETPLTSGPPAGYPRFATPHELARAIRATGWDACSTASNHTLDRGQAGIDATNRFLDRAGVRHTGGARSARESRRVTMLRARGVKVAFLAYT